MKAYTFVVSNPPHGELDAHQAAPCFGLTLAEARMKANFVAPEIWLADTEGSKMEEAARTLQGAGLSTVVLAGNELLNVPEQAAVKSFAFTDTHLVASLEDSGLELAYEAPITAVFCKAPEDVAAQASRSNESSASLGKPSTTVFLDRMVRARGLGAGAGMTDAGGTSAFFDIYSSHHGEARRISVALDVVDFSGLGDLQRSKPADNLVTFVAECERHFTQAYVDRRLENVRPRQWAMVGSMPKGSKQRRLFSFGTQALSKLLESISPDLKDVTQFELGSRLAYLMKR